MDRKMQSRRNIKDSSHWFFQIVIIAISNFNIICLTSYRQVFVDFLHLVIWGIVCVQFPTIRYGLSEALPKTLIDA